MNQKTILSNKKLCICSPKKEGTFIGLFIDEKQTHGSWRMNPAWETTSIDCKMFEISRYQKQEIAITCMLPLELKSERITPQ